MPYINDSARKAINCGERVAKNEGELNFVLTQECLTFLSERGKRYETFNAIIGALECCKLEFYRRMIVEYEDKKIETNGDVY